MTDYLTTDTDLASIADAIREKGGTSAQLAYPDGFVEAIANIPTGGADVYVKLAETELTLSTTNTSANPVAAINVPISDIWTSNNVIYVAIRDKAGARSGYCLGSDNWYVNANAANGTQSNYITAARLIYTYANGLYSAAATAYGVYAGYIFTDGRISIYTRYNSNYGTIDGTYKVEVYSLQFPDDISPFA